MQKRYLIHQTAIRVEMYLVQDFIQGVNYKLSETPQSDQFEEYGDPQREKRWFIKGPSGEESIGQLGLSYAPQGTRLLVTDEPYSVERGRDFDSEAFTNFVDLLLASLPSDWTIEDPS